ncbi:Hypothetical protein R9X50_00655500 [Acrodontium crateriforme]|uniref:Prenyltransferase alpha-alpha toroid domain-containing protein n=1 Tax=Acrodontium crateriforme TaxID=150365 RepID=A0AAQ3M830_9PEZI|nr:Hypothetical protein R9X50_00655500 [Acrodontium crateriforme]
MFTNMSHHQDADEVLELPKLEKARHVKYWTRCLKTLLPAPYTSNDSNRMYLAFFIISALDLLDSLTVMSTDKERQEYIDWIYHCQHPNGGFRMWPGTDFGERANEINAQWDPANVPATYFALSTLLILGDDLRRLRRRETLVWIQKMQRPNGSFGETLVNGKIEGGEDPRFGYCATGVRYILRGSKEGHLIIDGQDVQDIDFDAFVRCIVAAEAYDGGMADQEFHEPHAGYTYCSLGALAFIGRLNFTVSSKESTKAPADPEGVIRWLSARQTDLMDPDGALDTEFIAKAAKETSTKSSTTAAVETSDTNYASNTSAPLPKTEIDCAGMCGRTNKVADTCYAFWVAASLHILDQPLLYDRPALCNYLLDQTQHPVLGGFGKFPGDLPDLYHSYLGLAALSLASGEGMKELDAGMCLSVDARARLSELWESWHVVS